MRRRLPMSRTNHDRGSLRLFAEGLVKISKTRKVSVMKYTEYIGDVEYKDKLNVPFITQNCKVDVCVRRKGVLLSSKLET